MLILHEPHNLLEAHILHDIQVVEQMLLALPIVHHLALLSSV